MYPIAAAGLVLLIRRRTGGRDRGSLLDALSVTTALALLSWIFLIDPYVQDPGLTWLERATSIAYPLGDILIMATLARLLITSRPQPGRRPARRRRGRAPRLRRGLRARAARRARGRSGAGTTSAGWSSTSPGGSRPCARRWPISRSPCRAPSGEMSIGRIALLMAVSLVAPGVLLVDSITGDVPHGPIIAASSALLFLLVLARLSGVVSRHRQAVERERTLRSAGDDLVSAADAAGVAAAVRTAVGRLLPADATHRAVLLVDGEAAGVPGADTPDRASRIVSVDGARRGGGARAGGVHDRAVVPARPGRPAHRRAVRRAPARRGRRVGAAHPPRRPRGARLAGRARGRAGDAEPGGHPAQQRGVLPDARAERPRRHPDRRRRRPRPVRQPVGGDDARPGLRRSGRPSSTSSRRTTATPPSARCGPCGRG